ncbi:MULTISPECIES: ArsR/SmtB family transcription factor [Bacillus]|uniref:ArsR family transcriptional regulator n=2 Tax=Bacillus TaxID=1386 RepID=A0A0M5J9Z7_9BACI|nr:MULTISPECIES: winged helix-turn-helix domain-containing protein [Bacillus]ALC81707.1 ArsR family transcriptional regulator [Bacillus gobiensis]MBP1080765.1 DNA-binding transcriptional ArsR family regulator [Bacillus capparidis]MED1094618.1 winged helix-turn-helix domain-containing protein [Bacillus capparidis]
MSVEPSVSVVAALIADKSRASILESLMNGKSFTASELATQTKITIQTASSHLAKLVEGNLLAVEKHGRYRYYRLASVEVAEMIEMLSSFAPTPKVQSLKESRTKDSIHYARTCYDHLAGTLGVNWTQYLLDNSFIIEKERDYVLTQTGTAFFQSLGINIDQLQKKKRAFARKCLDWSERRYHLAGALGAAATDHFIENKWVERNHENRSLLLTEKGKENFKKLNVKM